MASTRSVTTCFGWPPLVALKQQEELATTLSLYFACYCEAFTGIIALKRLDANSSLLKLGLDLFLRFMGLPRLPYLSQKCRQHGTDNRNNA